MLELKKDSFQLDCLLLLYYARIEIEQGSRADGQEEAAALGEN
jgi:hypothetical protein